jgi:hypothetical protein
VTYAFEYFQIEYRIPLERMSRVYHKGRSSSRKNVCRSCYKLKMNNIHQREITGKMVRLKSINITPGIGKFLIKLFDQSWRHQRYIEFMWTNGHTFDAFLDYLCARDTIMGNMSGDIFDNEYLEYYYEDMVRSHFDVPTNFEATWNEEASIIGFQLNGTDMISINAHPVVE